MSEENRKTVAVYERTAQTYLDNTIAHDNKKPEHAREKREQLAEKIRAAFESLPTGAKNLEIGSADGDNAKILESFDYDVNTATALARICDALLPGGRFMSNVIDRVTHDCDFEMKDFPGDYKMGAERYCNKTTT